MDQNGERAVARGICAGDADLFCRVWERVGAQDRPDCPIEPVVVKPKTLEEPPRVWREAERESAADDFPLTEELPCLGQGSAAHGGQLQQYIREELEGWQLYRQLARRVGGPHAHTLTALAAEKMRCAKRLAAVHFLIGGVRNWPAERLEMPRLNSWLGVLRERFGAEQRRAYRYRAAACDTADPCLAELYRELAEACAQHANLLRGVLESAL